MGTFRNELEDNIFYYSCIHYFDKYKTYTNQQGLNTSKEIRDFIIKANLSAQVSQSIGRNSGFRAEGKTTIVVLPLLNGNSKHNFKQFPLNYISPNVKVLSDIDFDEVA